ncbi:MAG: CBS domain-containing protein [Chloroflexi bacterium]|nr:CBS domain-containing protein [Chloroflexota bacterium]
MPRVFTLGTVGGVVIHARTSAVIAFIMLVWFLAMLALPGYPALRDERPLTLWSVAFVSALALYASTVLHEMAHCVVARRRGVPANTITVSFFGGHSDIPQEYPRPGDEALISIAGPLVSLAVSGSAFALGELLPNPSEPLKLLLDGIFVLNGWLAIYNLLPVLPLDGGRALRGVIWRLRGNFIEATNISVTVGRLLAGALAAASLALLVFSGDGGPTPLPSWLKVDRGFAVIGLLLAYLLNNGARNVQRSAELQERLSGLTVAKVMISDPPTVPPGTTLAEIASQYFVSDRGRAVAVVRDDQTLVGLVAYSDVMKLPEDQRATRTAGQIMTPAADLVTVTPEDPVETAIRHMAHRHLNQLPVVEEGRLVGMIDRVNVLDLTQPANGRGGRRRAR